MSSLMTHPLFKANQALTEVELNELTEYLTLQDRDTRSEMLGAGILNGLLPVYEQDKRVFVMSAGSAVTSAGHLFASKRKVFTHLLPFQDVSGYPLFKPVTDEEPVQWLLDSVDMQHIQTPQIKLYQLVDPDEELPNDCDELVEIQQLDESFFDKHVPLLFLEIQDHASREYVNTYQPDAPFRQYSWKFLLAEKEDLLDSIRQTRDSFVSEESLKTSMLMSYQFPHLYLKRPRFKRLSGSKSSSDVYQKAVREALDDFQMNCDFWRNYVNPLISSFLDFTGIIETVETFIADIGAAKKLSAFHYECLKNLIESLNELNQSIFLFVQKFINSLDFPQHLLLGTIQRRNGDAAIADDPNDMLRTAFKSIHSSKSDDELSRMRFYYQKIVTMIETFEPVAAETCHIYLTPIQEKAPNPIPSFFRDTEKLAQYWDFGLSSQGKSYLIHTPERYRKEVDQLSAYETSIGRHQRTIAESYVYVYNLNHAKYDKAKFYRDVLDAVERDPTATDQIHRDISNNAWLPTVNFRPRTTAMDGALFSYLCCLYLATSQRGELDLNNDEIIIRAIKRARNEMRDSFTETHETEWGDSSKAVGSLLALHTINLIYRSGSCEFATMFEKANCFDTVSLVAGLQILTKSMELELPGDVLAVLEKGNDFDQLKEAVDQCADDLCTFFSKLLCYTSEIVHTKSYLRTPLRYYQERIDAFYIDGHMHSNVSDVRRQLDRLTKVLDIEFNYRFVQSVNSDQERKLVQYQFDRFKQNMAALIDSFRNVAVAVFTAKTDPLLMENSRKVLLHVDALAGLQEIASPGELDELLQRNYVMFMRGLKRITDFHPQASVTDMVANPTVNVELIYWFTENYTDSFIENLTDTMQRLETYDATPVRQRTPLFKYYLEKPKLSINTVFFICGLTHSPRIEPGSEFLAICDKHGFIYSHASLQTNDQLP
ncbi:hypothetical protein BVY04_04705 [bacterium M21]|nr:hypothetical protein BVY04_04705 [bacterium M21]